jgi:hypothetical protein
MGRAYSDEVRSALQDAAATGENRFPAAYAEGKDILIIGEGVYSLSLASALALSADTGATVHCPTECSPELLRGADRLLSAEEDIEAAAAGAKLVIADPLYRPICPESVRFVSLPQEAFSGRLYRQEIPNLVSDFESFVKEVL